MKVSSLMTSKSQDSPEVNFRLKLFQLTISFIIQVIQVVLIKLTSMVLSLAFVIININKMDLDLLLPNTLKMVENKCL